MSNNARQLLWKISLSMTSLYSPAEDFIILENNKNFWNMAKKNNFKIPPEILHGFPKSGSKFVNDSTKNRLKRFLGSFYGVHDKEELIDRLNMLLSKSQLTRIFNERRNYLMFLPYRERPSFIESFFNAEGTFTEYSLVNEYGKSLPPAGIFAFDISNHIRLCRIGGFLGYLDETELIDNLHKPATLAQSLYSSFEEFGFAATVGLMFCSVNRYGEYNYEYDYIGNLKKLLTHPKSYYRNLDWNMNLA